MARIIDGTKLNKDNETWSYFLDGKEVTKEQYEERYPPSAGPLRIPGGTPTRGWPIFSKALGVHPEQVQEANEHARRIGVPTEHTKDGKAILTDRAHRKRYLKAMGFRDNDAGYGD